MKVTGFASLFLQFIQQRALASRCPAVPSALLDCGKQSLWPLSAYKAVPLNISFSPWIINCLALGVPSATGECRAEGLGHQGGLGGVTKCATRSHWFKGEVPGLGIWVIYVLVKTVPIIKRKRKLKSGFSKEHREFVHNAGLQISLKRGKPFFFLLFDRQQGAVWQRSVTPVAPESSTLYPCKGLRRN